MKNRYLWMGLLLAGVGGAFPGGVAMSCAAPVETNSVAVTVTPGRPPAAVAPPQHQLTGAELYSINCNRCHAERYPTERTAANWKTIMLHMQVRANIPGSQARRILQYLQENSGR